MIAFLRGRVFSTHEKGIFLDVSGVGYSVFLPIRLLHKAQEENEIFLYTFHRIKEDGQELYGFFEEQDLKFFGTLLSVSGIGPKTALEMMELSVEMLQKAIFEEDIAFLTRIPGLGKKTASRLILELQGNLPKKFSESPVLQDKKDEAIISILENLGFSREKIVHFLKNFSSELEKKTEEEKVRFALRNL